MTVSRIRMAIGGPELSRIAQGFGSIAHWNKSPDELLNHVRRCMHLGVTTMDIAPIYGDGNAESRLGEALSRDPALRDGLELVTKCCIGQWNTTLYHYDTSKTHILWSVDQSLSSLQTDRLDLLLIHRPDPLMDADEVAEAFAELRQAGKVLHFGVSNFSPGQFELLASRLDFPLVTNEIEFSALRLSAWYDGVLDHCQRQRISPMAWGPLGRGRLFREQNKWAEGLRQAMYAVGEELGGASLEQVALAWILRHPARIVPILGTGKIGRIRSAVGAEALSLSREQWFKIWVASTGKRLP